MYIPQHMPFFSDFTCLFMFIWFQIQKRSRKFKMVITIGLQDISSKYITLENSNVFILYVYYLRIKLTRFFASVDASTCHIFEGRGLGVTRSLTIKMGENVLKQIAYISKTPNCDAHLPIFLSPIVCKIVGFYKG